MIRSLTPPTDSITSQRQPCAHSPLLQRRARTSTAICAGEQRTKAVPCHCNRAAFDTFGPIQNP